MKDAHPMSHTLVTELSLSNSPQPRQLHNQKIDPYPVYAISRKRGKTSSISYSFNAKGDLGLSKSAAAASAGVSVGVLSGNGADAVGSKGPSSSTVSGLASDLGAMASSFGQQAAATVTGAARGMFPENAKLADQGGGHGPLRRNDAIGALGGTYNTAARAANDFASLGTFLLSHGQNFEYVDLFPTFEIPPEMQRGAAIAEVPTFMATALLALPEQLGAKAGLTSRAVDTYALKAIEDGFYPVMKRGFREPQAGVWLNAGDVWKYGTTKNPATRYPVKYLDKLGVRYEPQSSGSLGQALFSEKNSILNYLRQNSVLPPGNKIIR